MCIERNRYLVLDCAWIANCPAKSLSLAKNTSDRSPSDISVLAMEQIGLRGLREGRNRDVTHRFMPQISICRSPETEPPEPLETRTLVVGRIFDEGHRGIGGARVSSMANLHSAYRGRFIRCPVGKWSTLTFSRTR